MKAAISAGELAQAMAEGNNMARTAGASMNWYAGALAAVVSNTQLDSTRVGTAYRTMFSRYANVKAGKFVAGKTEQSAEGFDEADYEDLNDVEKVLGKLRIDIRSGGSFKNIESVFSQIAGRWSDFNDVEKSAIATALAGTRQREVMVATFENWNEVLSLSTTAAASYGTAEQKMEAYNDSLAASQERVTAEFEKLTMGAGIQEGLKGINNALSFIIRNIKLLSTTLLATQVLKNLGSFSSYNISKKAGIINKLSRLSVFGSTGGILTYGGREKYTEYNKISDVMNTYSPEDREKIMGWMQGPNDLKASGLSKDQEDSITPEMKRLRAQLSSNNPEEKKIAEKMLKNMNKSTTQKAVENAFGIGAQIASGLTIGFTNNIAQSFGASGEAANTIGTVVGGLSSVLASTGMIGSLASIGISLATGLWSAYIKEQEEKLKESKEKAATLLNDYTNVVASESSVKRYDELAKGVDNLGNNVSLTDTEYQEFLDTGNKLADLFPTLVMRQDEAGNSLLGLGGKIGDISDKFNQLRDSMQTSAAIAATSDDIIEDRLKSYYKAEKSSESKLTALKNISNILSSNDYDSARTNSASKQVYADQISEYAKDRLSEAFGGDIWENAEYEGHDYALNLSNSIFKGEDLKIKKEEFLSEIVHELSDAKQKVVQVRKSMADLAIQEIIKNNQNAYNELSNTENQMVRDYFSYLNIPNGLDEEGYRAFIEKEWSNLSKILSNPEIDFDVLANGDFNKTAQEIADIRQEMLKKILAIFSEDGKNVEFNSDAGEFLINLGFKYVINPTTETTEWTSGSVINDVADKFSDRGLSLVSSFIRNGNSLVGNKEINQEILKQFNLLSESDYTDLYKIVEYLNFDGLENDVNKQAEHVLKSLKKYQNTSKNFEDSINEYKSLIKTIPQKINASNLTGEKNNTIESDIENVLNLIDKFKTYGSVLGFSNEEINAMDNKYKELFSNSNTYKEKLDSIIESYGSLIKKAKTFEDINLAGFTTKSVEDIEESVANYSKYLQDYNSNGKFSQDSINSMAKDKDLMELVAMGDYDKILSKLKSFMTNKDEIIRNSYRTMLASDDDFNKEYYDQNSSWGKQITDTLVKNGNSGKLYMEFFSGFEEYGNFMSQIAEAGDDEVRKLELQNSLANNLASKFGLSLDTNSSLEEKIKAINDELSKTSDISLKNSLVFRNQLENLKKSADYIDASFEDKMKMRDQLSDISFDGIFGDLSEQGKEIAMILSTLFGTLFGGVTASANDASSASKTALDIAKAKKELVDQEWEAMKVFDENALKKIGNTAYFSKMRAALQEEKSAIYSVMNQSGTTEAERLGYLKDIQDIDKELANLDEEEIKYKLTILELENATYNERIETQKQLIKTSDTYEELLENQKALNELLKEEYENRMGILDARIELSKYQNARYSNVYSNEYDESKSAQGFYSSRKSLEDKKNNIAAEANRRREQLRSLNPKLTTEEINNKSEISDLSKEWWVVNEEQANAYEEFLDTYIQNQKTVIDREKELGRMSKEEQLSNLGDILNYMQNIYVPQTEAEQSVLNKKIDELQRESISLQKEIFNDYIASVERKINNIQITKPNEWSSVDQIKEYYNSIMREQQLLIETELKQLQNTSNWTQEEIDALVDKYNNAQKEILNNQIELTQALTDRQESVYTALTEEVNDYIKEIEKQKEKISDAYDEEIERLNEINKAKEDSIKYTQLLQNLENAQKEKKRVFRQGIGWVYEQDRTSVKAAQDEIDKYLFDQKISDLQTAKDKEIESLQNSIDGWQDYLEALGEKHDEYEKEKREQLLFEAWGINENLSLSEKQAELYDKILLDRNDFLSEYKLGNESYSGFMTEFLEDYKANLELLEKYNKQMILLMKDIAAGGAFGNAESTANKMKANSEAWWNASDAEKERLAKENEELGSAMGWTRGSDGVWYDKDGNVAYTIDKSSTTTPESISKEWWSATSKNTGNASNIISGISNKISEASKSIGGSFTLGSLFNKSGYSEGLEAGPVTYTGLAMLHGSEDEPEYVLTNDQAWNILRNLSSNKPKFETNSSNKENSYNFYGDFKLPGVANAAQFFKSLMSYTNRKINTTSTLTE